MLLKMALYFELKQDYRIYIAKKSHSLREICISNFYSLKEKIPWYRKSGRILAKLTFYLGKWGDNKNQFSIIIVIKSRQTMDYPVRMSLCKYYTTSWGQLTFYTSLYSPLETPVLTPYIWPDDVIIPVFTPIPFIKTMSILNIIQKHFTFSKVICWRENDRCWLAP